MSPDWKEVLETASGDVRRLSYVVRYSSIPVTLPENVAEHSYWVVLNAALIHQAVAPEHSECLGAILLKAAIHDLPECVTGDVVRTFKYSSPALKEQIDKAEEKIIKHLPESVQKLMTTQLDKLLKLSGDRSIYINDVVKAADFMSLYHYMTREWMRGNREITPYVMRMVDDLRSMQDKMSDSELSGLYRQMANSALALRVAK